MTELVIRERHEKVAAWEMFTSAIGAFLGHNSETIKNTLRPLRKVFAGEVFQTGYSAEELLSQLRKHLAEVRKIKHNMERLDKMTAS